MFIKRKIMGQNECHYTSTALAMRSLEPASFSEKLLIYSGDRSCELDSSSGSNLLVSNILSGILWPLSNLDRPKKTRLRNKLYNSNVIDFQEKDITKEGK